MNFILSDKDVLYSDGESELTITEYPRSHRLTISSYGKEVSFNLSRANRKILLEYFSSHAAAKEDIGTLTSPGVVFNNSSMNPRISKLENEKYALEKRLDAIEDYLKKSSSRFIPFEDIDI